MGLEVEELKETSDNLFDVLVAEVPRRVALPVHEGVLKVVTALWQTPSSSLPTSKRVEKKYYVPKKGFEFLFTQPPPLKLASAYAPSRHSLGRVVTVSPQVLASLCWWLDPWSVMEGMPFAELVPSVTLVSDTPDLG